MSVNKSLGVGNAGKDDITSLKKWVSDNPMYELTHNGKVIILSVDQLSSHAEYRKACIAQADISPRPVAPAVWADMVDGLLKNMGEGDFIQLPGEVSLKRSVLKSVTNIYRKQ